MTTTEPVTGPLADLAEAMGVMTRYLDYLQRPVDVSAGAVRMALRAMGVDVADDRDAAAALAGLRRREARRLGPPCVVVRGAAGSIAVHPDVRDARLRLEDGAEVALRRDSAGLVLPADLPLGYHRYDVDTGGDQHGGAVIVAPAACPLPLDRPSYGLMVQLYAARSRQSWGMGDLGDLAMLARWSGEAGAAMVLLNPLHAAAPTLPQQPSPYSPTSRLFRNLLYLRIEDVPEFAQLDAAQRERVLALAAEARDASADRIDRDAAFRAKLAALEAMFAARDNTAGARRDAYTRWHAGQGGRLHRFAEFCALAERHGLPWHAWPPQLRRPSHGTYAGLPQDLRFRYELHCWIQWLLDEQLQAAQHAARDAGMAVGLIHDLAVGVDPGGADAWALQDELAAGVRIGAPPDGFNQKGQDWGLPPFVPQQLTATGYAPFRDMIGSVLRHAGGIRIDHVMGLWRQWWVPEGGSAADGTYVRYPADDLLAVLALEADRAGALVVGEDLGTVEPGVRERLAQEQILSSRVLYFERVDETDPTSPMLPSADYPRLALTSVTTHDLPTAAGWWADAEIAVQTELDLFSAATSPQAEAQRKAGERAAMLAVLRAEGLVGEAPSDHELVVAMHRFLARTPSLLVATGLGDALGDQRQPNMPGTVDEYPNWRLPLARTTPGGPQPVHLEDLFTDRDVRSTVAALADRASHRPFGQ